MRLAVFETGLKDFERELADFDPALITTGDAARAFAVFSALEKMTSAARTLVASRATESGDWKKQGHRSPASWVDAQTGSGLGGAVSMLESSQRLSFLPETTEALKRGELSGPQIREITATAMQNPEAEGKLLEAARSNGLKGLKEECRRVKARAMSEKQQRETYEEIRKNRYLRFWTDPDGAGRLEARLAPDDFARVVGAIRTEANAVFHRSRKAGHRESGAAYEADALVALVTGSSQTTKTTGATGTGRGPTTTMHLRVDLAALKRGELGEGESCDKPGVVAGTTN